MTGQRSVVAVLIAGTVTAVSGFVALVHHSALAALIAAAAAVLTVRAWRGRSVESDASAGCRPDSLAVAVEILGEESARLSLWHALRLGDDVHGYPVLLDGPLSTDTGIECVLMLATGTSLDDWRSRADELAAALAVPEVRCADAGPGLVRVDVRVVDPLVLPVQCPVPSEQLDLQQVPVGVTEDGGLWRVGVLYRHLLVVGVTGSGKGSVLWSVIAGLAPAIRDSLVSVRVVDPKGGMEFGCGAALFDAFATDAGEQALQLLRDAVEVMQSRATRLRTAGVRKHVPSTVEPLLVLVVDEAAALSAYVPDRRQRTEFESLLCLLLSQGRAVGVSVILAAQDASKETLGFRQLVPVRIALRLRESAAVPMVLGAGARDRGAYCDRIPDSLPGVGYVEVDGHADPVRVRAFEVTDSDIDALARLYAPVRKTQHDTVIELDSDEDRAVA